MNFIALISGGKDSIYTICLLKNQGYNLVGLLYKQNDSNNFDSFMYQTVGHEIIHLFSECLNVPIFTYKTKSICKNENLSYEPTDNDEVEDLYDALYDISRNIKFDALSSGAVLSNYQKNRVENVCKRLNCASLAPLWNKNQKQLLDEMINYGMDAKIVKVAADGFGKECIGFNLKQIRDKIDELESKKQNLYFNYCGEGGEYESITCYAPGFVKRILIKEYDIERHPDEMEKEWNVFYMKIKKYKIFDI
ncbi:diphthine--ammonia ligase [Gurleya vavrai]